MTCRYLMTYILNSNGYVTWKQVDNDTNIIAFTFLKAKAPPLPGLFIFHKGSCMESVSSELKLPRTNSLFHLSNPPTTIYIYISIHILSSAIIVLNSLMEITIISAQGLKNSSSSNPLSRRLRPFATVTTLTHGLATSLAYRTAVDVRGGDSPAWGDKFWLALDPAMFYHGHSCVYLELHTKHFLVGQSLLGWCQIPAADVIDGLVQLGSLRHLSYRLREKDGSRGHGVVNVAVRVEGSFFQGVHVPVPQRTSLYSDMTMMMMTPLEDENEPVIGIPVVRW